MEKSAIDALWNEHLTNLTTWDVSPVNKGPPGKAIRTCDGHCNLRGHTWMNLQMFDSTFFTKLIVIFHVLERNINLDMGAVGISGEKQLQWLYHNDGFMVCRSVEQMFSMSWSGREIINCSLLRQDFESSWEIEDESCKRISKKGHGCSDRMERLNADK